MKITSALKGEHGSIYALIGLVRQSIEAFEKADDTSQNSVALAAEINLLCKHVEDHAKIEEEILFPALDQFLPLKMGPLSMMRSEHEEIDRGIAVLRSNHIDEDKLEDFDDVLDYLYMHFSKEEHALFPMAEKFLSEEELHALGAKWAKQRGVTVI